MLKNIVIGNYFELNSLIHKIDARIKIFNLIILMSILMFVTNYIEIFISFIFIIALTKLSKVNIIFLLRSIKPFYILFILTLLFNIFKIDQDIGKMKLDYYTAFLQVFKLFAFVSIVSLFSITTSPLSIVDSFDYFLKPFRKYGLSVGDLSFILLIAFKFIPILINEFYEIKKAQMVRNVKFDGNLFQRIKNTVPIIIPLFAISLKKAHILAIALESRNFTGTQNRTDWDGLKIKKIDIISVFVTIAFAFLLLNSSILSFFIVNNLFMKQ